MKKIFKKLIFLTFLSVVSFVSIKTFASSLDLIASNFVNRLSAKYVKLPCEKQEKIMQTRVKKFNLIDKLYQKKTKITKQQKMFISKFIKKIISKIETKRNSIKYSCSKNNKNTKINKKPNTTKKETANKKISSIQKGILNAVNKERKKQGKNSLVLNNKLSNAAQKYANYLVKVNKGKRIGSKGFWFSHNSKSGKTPFDRIKAEGYKFWTAGENIAVGQRSVESVMKSWMKSPGHRKNILNSKFKEMGIGYNGYFRVQTFGTRK